MRASGHPFFFGHRTVSLFAILDFASMGRGAHSHDPEHPEDTWNLYQHIAHATALNATEPHALGIFKPHAQRCQTDSVVKSNDQELLIKVSFSTPVHVRRIMVIGGGIGGGIDGGSHPLLMKVYVNRDNIDFSDVENEVEAAQKVSLAVNETGEAFIHTAPPHLFTNLTSIAFFIAENHSNGEVDTVVRYIGMQGEHTHDRAEAVHAVYELVCQDDSAHGHGHSHGHSHGHGHGHGHAADG